jgi:DNA repair and recombination RAD54-like protein
LILAAARKPRGFVPPFKGTVSRPTRLSKPLFSPNAPGAVVLFEPKDIFSENKIHVVVDPQLASHLRPHQIEGVKFMYECVMGLKSFKGNGCILADDMGLGKTIQAITLIWTLMTQGPTGVPAVKRVVIVAPSSLVGNWCKEFHKWLGDRVDPVPMGDANKDKVNSALAKFGYSTDIKTNLLVVSYDQLRIHIDEICKIPDIDLVVCDEGHRLKNAQIKTAQAVNRLKTKKRIILSGTPIQNDLEEFHAMVSFVNPGILKDINVFRMVYAEPIMKMREPDADDEIKRVGRERSLQLARMTSEFILRRTSQVNKKYLPPKVDQIIFCRLTPLQRELYKSISSRFKLQSNDLNHSERETTFSLITDLKKLCNDPKLIYDSYKDEFQFGPDFKPRHWQPEYSTKLQFVDRLLLEIRNTSENDRVVIVSNYTQTLDILSQMCTQRGYAYFQLDGKTPVAKRQKLVDLFNDPKRPEFVFLLSSKAGGCGLNLVGANHLILFDPDWNPANDLQAMARVWRPGQQKKVYLYRVLCTGTIEEKIFQRQVKKMSLSETIVEGKQIAEEKPNFTLAELRDLFTFREETKCDTHDLLNCRCSKAVTKIPLYKRQAAAVDELSNWQHYEEPSALENYPLLQKAARENVSFVFLKECDPKNEPQTDEVKTVELCFDESEAAEESEKMSHDGELRSDDEL